MGTRSPSQHPLAGLPPLETQKKWQQYAYLPYSLHCSSAIQIRSTKSMYLRKFENEDEAKTTFLLLLALGKQPGRGDADFLPLCSHSPVCSPSWPQVSKRVEQLWSDSTFQCPLTSFTRLDGEVATSKTCWCGFLVCGLQSGHVTPVPYLVDARAVSDLSKSRRPTSFMCFWAIGVASFSNCQVFCPLVLLGFFCLFLFSFER